MARRLLGCLLKMKLGLTVLFTDELLNDLRRIGLAGAAIAFAFVAIIIAAVVYFTLHIERGMPASNAKQWAEFAWFSCLACTWVLLARERRSWPDTRTSTAPFHAFQSISLFSCLGLAFVTGRLDSKALLWFCFGIESIVAIFYVSYVFLGFTLRYKMPRSAAFGFVLAIASMWWSSTHVPAT